MTVVYGTVCLDVTHEVPRLPERGGYVEAREARRSLGGEGANTAVALALWGVDVVLVSNPIGAGHDADYLAQALEERGVRKTVFSRGTEETPVCHILVTPDGERTMFGHGFADMPKTSQPSLAPTRPGGWTTSDMNHGRAAREALDLAHAAGRDVYALDFVEPDEHLIAGSYWQSSTSWVGTPGETAANLKWAVDWAERQKCTAILTDGADGLCFARPGKKPLHLPAIPTEDVVDSTGAGDVFRAGMLYGLGLGWPDSKCLLFASAAGSSRSIGSSGTWSLRRR